MESSLSRPLSARQRPVSGKTNSNDNYVDTSKRPSSAAPLRVPSGTEFTAKAFRQSDNNGSSSQIRPSSSFGIAFGSKSAKSAYTHGSHESPFDRSRFPTVMPPEDFTKPKLRRPISCPQDIVDNNAVQNWIEVPDMILNPLDSSEKEASTHKIILRNRGRLWKLNREFKDQTPAEISAKIESLEDRKFIPLMRSMHSKERVLNLSSSEKVKQCLYEDNMQPVRAPNFDPFIMTMNTSRETRQDRMERLMSPSSSFVIKTNCRGYNHLPEFGTFCNFKGILNANQAAMLNR